mmetsp:Transcript_23725/g.38660  ORF Transcript_23725/g.38660 Transcript_23725/m.38660 type:complete len:145 (-) Transcript_23725:1309-1743(-)
MEDSDRARVAVGGIATSAAPLPPAQQDTLQLFDRLLERLARSNVAPNISFVVDNGDHRVHNGDVTNTYINHDAASKEDLEQLRTTVKQHQSHIDQHQSHIDHLRSQLDTLEETTFQAQGEKNLKTDVNGIPHGNQRRTTMPGRN